MNDRQRVALQWVQKREEVEELSSQFQADKRFKGLVTGSRYTIDLSGNVTVTLHVDYKDLKLAN